MDVAAETSVYLLPYDYQALASTNQATYELQKGSLLFMVVPGTAQGKVENGTAIGGEITQSCQWVADSPGRAYAFDGEDDYITLGDNSKLTKLDASDDLTLEAWVTSSDVQNTPRLIHHHSSESKYVLALKQQELDAAQKSALFSALEFDGNGDYVAIPDSEAIDFDQDQDFTIEVLIKAASTQENEENSILEKWSGTDGFPYVIRYLHSSKKIFVARYDGSKTPSITSTATIEDETFHHVAFIKNGSTLRLYIDGSAQGSTTDTTTASTKNSSSLFLGRRGSNSNYFTGQIDEVRIWNFARTSAEIKAEMNLRLNGNESGLVAYYHFENGLAIDYTYHGHDGTVYGNPQVFASPLSTTSYSVIAGVGNQFIESETLLPCGSWHHLAAVFNQSYGLQFNDGYLDCGSNSSLDIIQDLTIEVFVQVNNPIQKQLQGLITKGKLKDGTNQNVPYALYIDTDGKLVFAFEDKNRQYRSFKSNTVLNNQFHRIAVTRKQNTDTEEKKVNKVFEGRSIEVTESVEINKWYRIEFHIDGNTAGSFNYEDAEIGSSNQPLEIGRVCFGARAMSFQGTISEVRLWDQALDANNLGNNLQGNEQGLTACWRLEENEGNIAYDRKGDSHGTISGGVQWVKNPDPNGSPFQMYLDGNPVSTTIPTQLPGWGNEQFTLGAYKNGDNFQDCFSGTLEEIRIWKIPRTQEQIQDNLFARLKGEKQNLIANYTFDLDNETELRDHSLLGNHLLVSSDDSKPLSVLSTAPISNDIAQVRSALAGVKTQFQEKIESRPAVQEYGDLQYDVDSNLFGVMKRCYSYIQEGQWHLLTGFKVGNLITEWIGQAQFNPQVIGFIEGAPPVPSENLTAGPAKDYTNATSLEVVEAESVNYNFSTSKEEGIDSSFELDTKMGGTFDTRVLLAPLGFGTSFKLKGKFTAGVKGNMEASNSWSSEKSISVGKNTSKSTSVSLGGNWEAPGQQLNPDLGRRFQPGNMGFSLVQSETADVFALRLAHNNALVSFRFQPNPDIPKDVNIIPFPINPRYTKQGTLDGAVGYTQQGKVLDPDYPNATGYGEYSYFKPKEAYAIKKRIERQEQELKNYYENFEVSGVRDKINKAAQIGAGVGAAGGAAMGPVGSATLGAVGAAAGTWGASMFAGLGTDTSLPEKFAKRNLVNTYVWTADGGFYAESTELTQVKQETFAGSYSLSGMVGVGLNVELEAPVVFEMSMYAMLGGHLNITKTKSEESANSFSIDVSVDTPGDLQKYDENLNRVYDNDGNPVNVAGKVDAYRFMTFYNDSSKENFEDLFNKVVDPIWLEQSDHPNAVAMRQANEGGKTPPCWRVFHRVTFVSRLLPEFPDVTAPPLEKAMKVANIESNYELIKKLEPFVKNKTASYIEFADAVRNTLKTYLPELQPHAVDIIKYVALYFGVEEEI